MARSLGVDDDIPAFGDVDGERLLAINTEFARQPIRTFTAAQRSVIQASVAEGYATGEPDLYKVRNRIEDTMRKMTVKETYKLDRIVRTSVHQAASEARVGALEDSGLDEVKLITANDGRVRASHKVYHNKVVPVSVARRILKDINCRCVAVKPTKKPKTAPAPEDLAAAIMAERENGLSAQEQARGILGVA